MPSHPRTWDDGVNDLRVAHLLFVAERPFTPRRTTNEIRARQHPVVVCKVGGMTEAVVVLITCSSGAV
jgi:hypothetical protein